MMTISNEMKSINKEKQVFKKNQLETLRLKITIIEMKNLLEG